MASLLNMSGGSLLGKGLPYDAEIEYLQGDGYAYIDTGIAPADVAHPIMELTLMNIATTSDYARQYYIVGSDAVNNKRFSFTIFNESSGYDNEYRIGYYYYWSAGYGGWNNKYTIKEDAITGEAFYNGGKIGTGLKNVNASKNSILLFSMHDSSGGMASRCKCRIYRYRLYNDNEILQDLIPVRIGTTGYLYDKVSGLLFGNAGTGNFILGNDI